MQRINRTAVLTTALAAMVISGCAGPSVQTASIANSPKFELPSTTPVKKPFTGVGQWKMRIDKSEIDDVRTCVVQVSSSRVVTGWLNQAARPILVMYLDKGWANLQLVPGISLDTHYSSYRGTYSAARIRYDGGAHQDFDFTPDSDRKQFRLPYDTAVKVKAAERVLIELDAMQAGSPVAEFDVRGIENAYTKTVAQCGDPKYGF